MWFAERSLICFAFLGVGHVAEHTLDGIEGISTSIMSRSIRRIKDIFDT